MTRKLKPIVRGNIVVWPIIPQWTASVKLRNRTGDPARDNVIVLPMIRVDVPKRNPAPSYNDIQKIIAKTMRGQRHSKRSTYAQEKLRKMFLDKA